MSTTLTNRSQAELENEFGAGRVATLADGRAGLRGGLRVEIVEAKGPDVPAATIDFIGSDETLDRYDEVISAAGWRLDNYRKNPVFQNAHKYGDIMFTLGRSLVTEVRDGKLYQRIEFATSVNPMARIAYGLYRGKFLNAVSVGFIPIRWETGTDQSQYRRKYLEQELLELSAVGIPANPNALQLGLKAGAVEVDDVWEAIFLLEDYAKAIADSRSLKAEPRRRDQQALIDGLYSLREKFCGTQADPKDNTSELVERVNDSHVLQLTKSFREVLKR